MEEIDLSALEPSFKVGVSIRPVNARETQLGVPVCVEVQHGIEGNEHDSRITVRNFITGDTRQFDFETVHDVPLQSGQSLHINLTNTFRGSPKASPKAVEHQYRQNEIEVKFVSEYAWQGQNVNMILYGQLGAGKTRTLFGDNPPFPKRNQQRDQGLIHRLVGAIFEHIGIAKEREGPQAEFKVEVSMVEICEEKITDIFLFENAVPQPADFINPKGSLFETFKRHPVSSPEDVQRLIDRGLQSRVMMSMSAPALMPRPHTIFVMYLTQSRVDSRNRDYVVEITSRISIVDMASTTHANLVFPDTSKAKVRPQSTRKAMNLEPPLFYDQSLFNFIKCMSNPPEPPQQQEQEPPLSPSTVSLSEGEASDGVRPPAPKPVNTVVPLHNQSALTRMLHESFEGRCKSLLLACVCPTSLHWNATMHTLSFAEQVRHLWGDLNGTSPQSSSVIHLKRIPLATLRSSTALQHLADLRDQLHTSVDKTKVMLSLLENNMRTMGMSVTLSDGGDFAVRATSSHRRRWSTNQAVEQDEGGPASPSAPRALSFSCKGSPSATPRSAEAFEDAYLVTLHPDPNMSDRLVYPILSETTTCIGTGLPGSAAKDSDPPNEIQLEGSHIYYRHCRVLSTRSAAATAASPGMMRYMVMQQDPDALVFLNGQQLLQGQAREVRHNDRVVLGLHHAFRFVEPGLVGRRASNLMLPFSSASSLAPQEMLCVPNSALPTLSRGATPVSGLRPGTPEGGGHAAAGGTSELVQVMEALVGGFPAAEEAPRAPAAAAEPRGPDPSWLAAMKEMLAPQLQASCASLWVAFKHAGVHLCKDHRALDQATHARREEARQAAVARVRQRLEAEAEASTVGFRDETYAEEASKAAAMLERAQLRRREVQDALTATADKQRAAAARNTDLTREVGRRLQNDRRQLSELHQQLKESIANAERSETSATKLADQANVLVHQANSAAQLNHSPKNMRVDVKLAILEQLGPRNNGVSVNVPQHIYANSQQSPGRKQREQERDQSQWQVASPINPADLVVEKMRHEAQVAVDTAHGMHRKGVAYRMVGEELKTRIQWQGTRLSNMEQTFEAEVADQRKAIREHADELLLEQARLEDHLRDIEADIAKWDDLHQQWCQDLKEEKANRAREVAFHLEGLEGKRMALEQEALKVWEAESAAEWARARRRQRADCSLLVNNWVLSEGAILRLVMATFKARYMSLLVGNCVESRLLVQVAPHKASSPAAGPSWSLAVELRKKTNLKTPRFDVGLAGAMGLSPGTPRTPRTPLGSSEDLWPLERTGTLTTADSAAIDGEVFVRLVALLEQDITELSGDRQHAIGGKSFAELWGEPEWGMEGDWEPLGRTHLATLPTCHLIDVDFLQGGLEVLDFTEQRVGRLMVEVRARAQRRSNAPTVVEAGDILNPRELLGCYLEVEVGIRGVEDVCGRFSHLRVAYSMLASRPLPAGSPHQSTEFPATSPRRGGPPPGAAGWPALEQHQTVAVRAGSGAGAAAGSNSPSPPALKVELDYQCVHVFPEVTEEVLQFLQEGIEFTVAGFQPLERYSALHSAASTPSSVSKDMLGLMTDHDARGGTARRFAKQRQLARAFLEISTAGRQRIKSTAGFQKSLSRALDPPGPAAAAAAAPHPPPGQPLDEEEGVIPLEVRGLRAQDEEEGEDATAAVMKARALLYGNGLFGSAEAGRASEDCGASPSGTSSWAEGRTAPDTASTPATEADPVKRLRASRAALAEQQPPSPSHVRSHSATPPHVESGTGSHRFVREGFLSHRQEPLQRAEAAPTPPPRPAANAKASGTRCVVN